MGADATGGAVRLGKTAAVPSVVTVEAVRDRTAWRRFVELPYALHRADPRWAPPVLAYERWRLDVARNPVYRDGEVAWWLARVMGRVAARILAWAPEEGGEGAFGFFDATDDADADATAGLVEEAAGWLRNGGCSTMVGPLAFNGTDECGVLTHGFDVAGTTGREWHPPWYHVQLEAAGMEPSDERRTWRLDLSRSGHASSPMERGGPSPPQAATFADPNLVLTGPDGEVAAVPDVARRRRLQRRGWEGCTVVRVSGDPARLVPALGAAAAEAGYRWTVAPWTPDDRPPETVHTVYRRPLR
jgi:hypothetical protein